MELPGGPEGDLGLVFTLAEALEQASRDGLPVARLLDELDTATDRLGAACTAGHATIGHHDLEHRHVEHRHVEHQIEHRHIEHDHIERWRRVVVSVRHDVETGRVRSVTGIAREARRLALQAGPRDRSALPG
jgi:hypothetical protein